MRTGGNHRDHQRAPPDLAAARRENEANPGSQTARASLDEWFSPFPSRQAQQATRAGLTCNARQLHVPPGNLYQTSFAHVGGKAAKYAWPPPLSTNQILRHE
ncbi:hypothetical protein ACCO45_006154 [Purpureocillium lilacinum]|uniref:Uncharacterized protein n=1 Tax=Purpureocillium lilacinum TaxID=33203 RepID=A0ACC4DYP5_PURLI